MRHTFKVLFYIKRSALLRNGKAPIMGRITINGMRSQFATHLSVPPMAWDVAQNRAIGRSAEMVRVNRELDAMRTRIERCYDEVLGQSPYVTPLMVRNRFFATDTMQDSLLNFFARHNEAVLRQVEVDRSRSTYYKYRSVEVHLQRFIPDYYGRADLRLEELNRDFLVAFHGYLLRELGRRKNTVWVYLTALKHVLSLARKKGVLSSDLFADYRLHSEFVTRSFLSTQELNRLIALSALPPTLQLIRDSFLFSCFTGLSFIDLKLLRLHHIHQVGRVSWIETTRHKTGSQVQVRLFDLPKAILSKYRPKEFGEAIFPLPSNSWCNRCLTQLMRMAGIPKHITFHAARHTFATTLTLSQGMPIETISKLLGHRNIRTTQIYATVTHDHLNDEMNRLSKRLDSICQRWQA
ncbi:MAG: site-specific integrase [Alistipes sp.]|nr:site-specific integrase [Rikenellaceae bacterium]MBO5188605.1 site-specific integrase [Alistipes sp.]